MKYQTVISLLSNAVSKSLNLGGKKWIQINEDAHRTYNANSQVKFKNSMSYVPTLRIWSLASQF